LTFLISGNSQPPYFCFRNETKENGIISHYHCLFAALLARVFLGCLFFFQGYDAVFKVKIKNVVETFEDEFSKSRIPKSLIVFASWFTSYTELIGGALLILGLFQYAALCLLGINLLIAAIGFGINVPMWNTRHVFPRLILILFLLIVPQSWNVASLDTLFFKP
jgi:putative oxidoreductase